MSKYAFRTLNEKDEVAVKGLVKKTFGQFLDGDYWDWKYKRNPNFDPSLVGIAERDGKIIGVHHWLVRDVKITRSLAIKAVLGGDLAIDANHQGQGLSKSLLRLLRSDAIIKSHGIIASYAFINPKLAKRLHQPLIGFVEIPTSTITCTKLLNWKKLSNRISTLRNDPDPQNEQTHSAGKPDLRIGFQISGAPPLTVAIAQGKIAAREENDKKANLVLKSNLATLASLKQKEHRTMRLLKALLTGKIRIRGSFFSLIRFYKNYSLFKEIFDVVS